MRRFGQNRKSRTSVTMAFSAILLSVLFAGSAFLVLLFGARVYESVVEKSAESYTSRTLLTYITEKIRHFDSDGNVSVRQLDGISALALESAQADEKILTYIYEYEGSIRELTVADAAQWNPEDGDFAAIPEMVGELLAREEAPEQPAKAESKVYVCNVCGWTYDEAKGDPEHGIAPGTKWEDLPDDFKCPVCGAPKSDFSVQ